MTLKVQLFAAFAEIAGTRELLWDCEPGLTCAGLWRQIRLQYPPMDRIPALFAIGDEYVHPETELNIGDVLLIFPPVSGGSTSCIFRETLSVDRALESIRDENGGGEAVFIGRVRRWNEGRRIQHLFYECHIPMAEREIARIAEEMSSKWPLRKVHFEHRIGKLEIGDIAVIVAVSAEHRREAMDACRYGIDELKHRVPIWKKEVSEDGEEWIGVCEH